jgi:hypothetical protein
MPTTKKSVCSYTFPQSTIRQFSFVFPPSTITKEIQEAAQILVIMSKTQK